MAKGGAVGDSAGDGRPRRACVRVGCGRGGEGQCDQVGTVFMFNSFVLLCNFYLFISNYPVLIVWLEATPPGGDSVYVELFCILTTN